MKAIEKAQAELNQRISDYYDRTPDGGNEEEKYRIAYRVAQIFDVDVEELDY